MPRLTNSNPVKYITLFVLLMITNLKLIAENHHDSLHQAINELALQKDFSGTVLQYKQGKVAYAAAFGLASYEDSIENNMHTLYNLGSVTKLFTHIAILKLQQSGKLNIEDKIIDWLPELGKGLKAEITIDHLINMKSGFSDYLHIPEYQNNKTKYTSQETYLSFATEAVLEFKPGTDTKYSNLGYELLGIIIERASHQNYIDFIKEHIFKPSGMNHSGWYTIHDKPLELATGYTQLIPLPLSNWDEKAFKGSAAGGSYSTVYDLVNLTKALKAQIILDAQHLQALLRKFDKQKQSNIYIAGRGPGINASLYMNLSNLEVVAVLSNIGHPSAKLVNDLFKEQSQIKRGPKPKKH